MLFFGYIVTEIKYKDLKEDIVQVVTSLEECKADKPKMIVGLDNAKEYAAMNGWNFDILDHTYPNGDMWTFKKTEKREFYEEDIETFKKRIVGYQEKNVTYYYINIFKLRYSQTKRLYDVLFNNTIKNQINYIIIDKEMLYIALDNFKVMGISFTHLRYIGIERERIINKLKTNPFNRLYFTTSKNMWKLKEWFNGKEYVIASIFARNARKHI